MAVRLPNGDETIMRADDAYFDSAVVILEVFKGKWFYRLSADGYLDATDWCGPWDSQAVAEASLEANEQACHNCGDPMPDDDSTECEACEAKFC